MNALLEVPILIDGCDTIPKLFRLRVRQQENKIAMREKNLGIWKATPWKEYGEHAFQVGMALLSLGLRRGEVCSVLSENNKEWLFIDLGVLCAGGVTNGVYPTDSPIQLQYLMNDSKSRFLFVENEEQLDKILQVRGNTPSLEKIIVMDTEGLRDFHDDQVLTLNALYDLGKTHGAKHPEVWDREIEKAKPDDLMILIYTSGTTGPPKGAMISHRNMMAQMTMGSALMPGRSDDEQLSFLPLCHIAERLFSAYWSLNTASTVNFAEGPDTVLENLREVSPTIFLAVPRVWEKLHSSVMIQLQDATRFSRLAYRWAMATGDRIARLHRAGGTIPRYLKISGWCSQHLVLKNLRRLLGLDRVRWAATGAAPIAADLIKWYHALGVDLYEVYGQTECTGVATGNYPGRAKVGSIGVALPGTGVRLSEAGEILVKGPQVFLGYFNQPEKTQETVIDGWLHTGDVGEADEQGFYKITDRMKDIIITAGGKNNSPSEIENQLKCSPYISDAVVIGDRRKYLTCLIMIDHDNVVKYAQDHAVPFTNYASLCRAPEIEALIGKEVETANQNFARVETVKKFRLIDQQLMLEDDELTPTMKLKRKFVQQKYSELIESMYS